MILAGDVGGTNTRLAVFQVEEETLKSSVLEIFPSRAHKSLHEIVKKFVAKHEDPVEFACFGVAGPVEGDRSETSNLPWIVDARQLAVGLGLKTTYLINDLEANAYGIAALGPDDFVCLKEGDRDARGNQALIAAGTGLGEAGLHWDGESHHPFASEGGHTDFGPRNELEFELLKYLVAKYKHVSYERVVSGPGLHNIYNFMRDTRLGIEEAWVAEKMREEDPPTVISEAALEGRCDLSVNAMDLFISIYGAEAGNLALKVMATGGVFLGGGIAPKILPKLKGPAFLEAFTAKGRMRPLLEAMPVRVILNDMAALIGAARFAALKGGLLG